MSSIINTKLQTEHYTYPWWPNGSTRMFLTHDYSRSQIRYSGIVGWYCALQKSCAPRWLGPKAY
ncbi:hypothetical protein YC2023_093970 [Brassica napus]